MCLDSPDFFVLVFFVCERCIDWSTRVSELVSYPNNNSTLVCTGYRIVPYVSVSRSVCGLGEQVVTCVCVSFFFVLDVLCISSSSRKDCVLGKTVLCTISSSCWILVPYLQSVCVRAWCSVFLYPGLIFVLCVLSLSWSTDVNLFVPAWGKYQELLIIALL